MWAKYSYIKKKYLGALIRVMPSIGRPKLRSRKILAEVAHSTILNAAPVWSEGLKVTKYVIIYIQKKLAIRILGLYRTTSRDILLVLTGLISISIDIIAEENRVLYLRSSKKQKSRPRKGTSQTARKMG